MVDSCYHLDRFRTKDQDSFEWGFWSGNCISTPNIMKEFDMKFCNFGTTVGNFFKIGINLNTF